MTAVQTPRRTATAPGSGGSAVLALRDAELSYGARRLWSHLDLDLAPGEFVAVLGPNGAGKTSLLRTVLGQQRLTSGTMSFLGQPVRRGHRRIGYIPQQRLMDAGTPLRARDMIAQGQDRTGRSPVVHRGGRRAVGRRCCGRGRHFWSAACTASMFACCHET